MAGKKTWKEMSPSSKAGTVAVGIAQVALMIAAQRDISRRPAELINGPKAAWRVGALINFIGPMGYFVFGRKRPVRQRQGPGPDRRTVPGRFGAAFQLHPVNLNP